MSDAQHKNVKQGNTKFAHRLVKVWLIVKNQTANVIQHVLRCTTPSNGATHFSAALLEALLGALETQGSVLIEWPCNTQHARNPRCVYLHHLTVTCILCHRSYDVQNFFTLKKNESQYGKIVREFRFIVYIQERFVAWQPIRVVHKALSTRCYGQ
jgi:hypothetical protein